MTEVKCRQSWCSVFTSTNWLIIVDLVGCSYFLLSTISSHSWPSVTDDWKCFYSLVESMLEFLCIHIQSKTKLTDDPMYFVIFFLMVHMGFHSFKYALHGAIPYSCRMYVWLGKKAKENSVTKWIIFLIWSFVMCQIFFTNCARKIKPNF